jgi:hypothetical protein
LPRSLNGQNRPYTVPPSGGSIAGLSLSQALLRANE